MQSKGLLKRLLTLSVVMLLAQVGFAASTTANGITLTWPDYPLTSPGTGTAILSCEPSASATANTVTLTGIPEGATVTASFGWFDPSGSGSPSIQPVLTFNNVTGGSLAIAVPYPSDSESWPGFNSSTNERSIGLFVMVNVSTSGVNTRLTSGKWWARCLPPPPVFGGCTPGYWKQEHHFDSWTGYSPTDDFNAVFGVTASFNPRTLKDALSIGGGGEKALARHAVAALLNAVNPNFTYGYTSGAVITGVQNAYSTRNFEPFKNQLDAANNAGCPLN